MVGLDINPDYTGTAKRIRVVPINYEPRFCSWLRIIQFGFEAQAYPPMVVPWSSLGRVRRVSIVVMTVVETVLSHLFACLAE